MTGIKGIIVAAGGIISQLITLTGGIALLVFFYGLVKYLFKSGDPKSHEEGRNLMIWGVITLFVMISTWGLVIFVGNAFNIHSETDYIPAFKPQSSLPPPRIDCDLPGQTECR